MIGFILHYSIMHNILWFWIYHWCLYANGTNDEKKVDSEEEKERKTVYVTLVLWALLRSRNVAFFRNTNFFSLFSLFIVLFMWVKMNVVLIHEALTRFKWIETPKSRDAFRCFGFRRDVCVYRLYMTRVHEHRDHFFSSFCTLFDIMYGIECFFLSISVFFSLPPFVWVSLSFSLFTIAVYIIILSLT